MRVKLLVCLISGTTVVFANQSNNINKIPDFFLKLETNYVATLSIGPVWVNKETIQRVYLTSEIEKAYAVNNSTSTLVDGEIFFGFKHLLQPSLQGHFGLAVGLTNSAKVSGEIWDDADPQFNNYIYNYKVQHTYVAFKGKLFADIGTIVIPWVSGSLGVGFNNAHHFYSTPVISEALPTPDFLSYTQSSFTYTLGIGVQKIINQHWQTGVGYEFADWGKSKLGSAPGQTLDTGVKLAHFYTSGALFNLTYVA